MQQCIKIWLALMPIEYDKSEAHFNHNLLVDLAIGQPKLLFQQEASLVQVINCYAKIIETKLVDQ